MTFPSFLYVFSSLILLTASKCTSLPDQAILSKIQFDYSTIDAAGLRNGAVAVDYEFCIAADEVVFQKVIQIDEAVKLMMSSKGRIGCSKQEWLCINSTYSKDWEKKLYALASLKEVLLIRETHYE